MSIFPEDPVAMRRRGRSRRVRIRAAACILAAIAVVSGCRKPPGNACVPDTAVHPLAGSSISLATRIADRWIEGHPAANMAWSWGEGVLMFSMVRLYDATGTERYLTYYTDWMDSHISQGYYLLMSDSCPPGIAAADLYRRTCDSRYKKVLDDIYTYLTVSAPRTPEGGISHLGTLVPTSPQLWIDSLFMFGMPAIEAARATGNDAWFEIIAEQFPIFASLLQDTGTGLFRHAWIDGATVPADAVFWGRGNGWVLASLTNLLASLQANHPDRAVLKAVYDPLVSAVVSSQDATTGLWWTVLNRPGETYTETSASALFIYSLAKAMNDGLTGSDYTAAVSRGMEGILGRISDPAGLPVVTGTSEGTNPGDFPSYGTVPVGDDITYGVGSVILALCEHQRMLSGR